MGLFSGSKSQSTTSVQTSAANYGSNSGNSGSLSTYENSETTITEIDGGAIESSMNLAGRALDTIASLSDRSQTLQLATVGTLANLNQGHAIAAAALESGSTPADAGEASNKKTLIIAVAVVAAAWVVMRARS